ncbi:protein S100-P-like [Engystomops pustulosus]|uniref:protein S100-P-like n=1 Tax=Engystomops pustulosus TaxID=76066 RepID=UPI003AFA42E9
MTELETAMSLIINVFDNYSGKDGKGDTLSKGELKTLIEKELPGILRNAKDKSECDKLMKDLDIDGDAEVDFKEFIVLVAALTSLGHERFEKMGKK